MKNPALLMAMILSGDRLYLAGQNDSIHPSKGGFLRILSSEDGGQVAEMQFDSPPVCEGLAVAGTRLCFSTRDGKLLCVGN